MVSPLRRILFWTGSSLTVASALARLQFEAFLLLKFQGEVLVPNAVVFQLQIVSGGASDAKRKMAGNRRVPAFFPERMLS